MTIVFIFYINTHLSLRFLLILNINSRSCKLKIICKSLELKVFVKLIEENEEESIFYIKIIEHILMRTAKMATMQTFTYYVIYF